MAAGEVVLEIERMLPGRLVLASEAATLHLGHRYEIHRSHDGGVTWARVSALPRRPWRRVVERSRLACRLLRHEVRALARLSDGRYVAASREGVYQGREGDRELCAARIEVGTLPLMPPMRLTVGPDDVVVFGEYGSRRHGRPVRLFASRDGGRSFQVVQSLAAGSVLHVHNVLHDPHLGLYWVLAGDHDHEPGIGQLSRDLARFEWLVKGEQRFRAVAAFDFGDRLVYATDTEREANGLIVLDKASGHAERLRDFEGSCIYGCRYGGLYAITTTVEPSPVNRSRFASLLLSRDGFDWRPAWRAEKDRWSADWFQFGSVVLPSGATERELVAFSGQAVRALDGRTAIARAVGI